MRRLRLRCNGVRKSSASRIYDGALTIMGRWGRILVTLRLDTCTRLGCGFEERAVGAPVDRIPVLVPLCLLCRAGLVRARPFKS